MVTRLWSGHTGQPALPRVFWALWCCQLINRMGGFVQPFLVLYLTQHRQISIGTAGAVAAAVGGGSVVSMFMGGWLSDRIGRRRTLLIGFAGTAVALIGLGAASTMTAIWIGAFAVGLMSDLSRPAVSATVADMLGPNERTRAYGLLFWAINLGFSVSTVAAGVLAGFGFGLLFWINAATSATAALIVWSMVPDTRPAITGSDRRALSRVAARDVMLMIVIAINLTYSSIYMQAYSTLPLVMAADGLSSSAYGSVIALNGVVIVVLQPFTGRLISELDRSVALASSMLIVGLGFAVGAIMHSWWGYALSVVIWTVGEIGFAAVAGSVVADLSPIDLRGGYIGLGWTAWGLGSVLGPLLGTRVLESFGRTTLWVGCGVLGMVLFAAQVAIRPALRRRAALKVIVEPTPSG